MADERRVAVLCVEGQAAAALELLANDEPASASAGSPSMGLSTLKAAVLTIANQSPTQVVRGWHVQTGTLIPERAALRASWMLRVGDPLGASREFKALSDTCKDEKWARRAALAQAHVALAHEMDLRKTVRLVGAALRRFQGTTQERECRTASARVLAEVGEIMGAREVLGELNPSEIESQNVSRALAHAYLEFSAGRLEQAAGIWRALEARAEPPADSGAWFDDSDESVSSRLAAYAVGLMIGDLGDPVLRHSRWARHEAANNLAVCALHRAELDGAVEGLERVARDFGGPGIVDPVLATNAKTLYDLQKRGEADRFIS